MIKKVQVIHDSEEVRIHAEVNPVCGITDDSRLELTVTNEGLIMDLWEVTDRCTGSSEECTGTFSSTFDELIELMYTMGYNAE